MVRTNCVPSAAVAVKVPPPESNRAETASESSGVNAFRGGSGYAPSAVETLGTMELASATARRQAVVRSTSRPPSAHEAATAASFAKPPRVAASPPLLGVRDPRNDYIALIDRQDANAMQMTGTGAGGLAIQPRQV
jgi:hypothetical protein